MFKGYLDLFCIKVLCTNTTIANEGKRVTDQLSGEIYNGNIWILDYVIATYNPAVVAEWSKTLVQIQVSMSPLQTQAQIPLGTLQPWTYECTRLLCTSSDPVSPSPLFMQMYQQPVVFLLFRKIFIGPKKVSPLHVFWSNGDTQETALSFRMSDCLSTKYS